MKDHAFYRFVDNAVAVVFCLAAGVVSLWVVDMIFNALFGG